MTLRVVTHRNWLAEQFKQLDGVHVVQDFGLDFDPANLDDYWWAPGAWVARAYKSGMRLPLMSCGVDWLPNLPEAYRGRKVQNKLLAEIFPGRTQATFAKLPEVKHDGVPAKVYGECYLRETLNQYNLPAETIWQLQEPVEFVTEARFWIAHRHIVAFSPYRHRDWVWGAENRPFHPVWDARMSKMARFLDGMLSNMSVGLPRGCVIDVGITDDGDEMVIEANAAWSSGPYDGDPAGIFEAIKASHDFEGKYPEWAWRHSPVFDNVAPLKIRQRL
jgi:hypothetical protein